LRPQLLTRAQDLVSQLEAGIDDNELMRQARARAHELATTLAEHASPALAALARDFDRTLERQGAIQALPVGRILVRVLAEDGGVRPPAPRRP
jgi:HPt (histidine-containing phosphotransfer) domain-containing protein